MVLFSYVLASAALRTVRVCLVCYLILTPDLFFFFFYTFKHLLDRNLFLSPFLLLLLLLLCLHMGPKPSVTPREFPGAAVTVLKVAAAPSVLRAADPCRLHSHLMETSSVRLAVQSHVPVCCC